MKKGKKLSERIEKERIKNDEPNWSRSKKSFNQPAATIPSATQDTDVVSYVESFASDLETLRPLPQTSLLTPERAQAAVYVLNQKLAQIEKFRKTAEALKSLLLSQGSKEEFN